jgi:hypothetical protein
LGKGKLV